MNRTLILLMITILSPAISAASSLSAASGGAYPAALPTDHLSAEQRAQIEADIAASVAQLKAQGKLPESRGDVVTFGWPMAGSSALLDPGYHGISNFVDQDSTFPGALLDYNCGERTYDLTSGYNHRGIDFFTWPFGWKKMDLDHVQIVAVAPGTIILKSDGNFDRSCGLGGGNWNAVYVQHADGSIAWYGHMKDGSLTAKAVGDTVAAGEVLGVIGSSGSSTGPHLHLEIYDNGGNLIEPYAGTCNSLNASSWWTAQREYFDSAVNAAATSFAPPFFPDCPMTEQPNERRMFLNTETIYFVAYYRDQTLIQTSTYTIRRPDGSVYTTWQHNSNSPHYSASFWYWTLQLSGQPTGTWTFSVDFEGTTTEHFFELVPLANGDTDGVSDHLDNCINHPNPSQLDADDDGYGNACDGDFNNDGTTNVVDLGILKGVFFSADPVADLNGDGVVNVVDLGILRTLFFMPPGPSAYAP